MGGASKSRRRALIELLEAYRRPGTPVFAYHYRRLPPEVRKPQNADALLSILKDPTAPARARDHAAGVLGEIGCRAAIPALIDALSSPRTRRGAAAALGMLKAKEARDALAELAPRLGVARWAHEELSAPGPVGAVVASLRDGQLRRIGPKIAALDARARAELAASLVRLLGEQTSRGRLDHSHRWLVTSLQHLAPAGAAGVICEALRLSIGVKNCCGCLCKRTMWAAAAIGSPEAIPALVEMIARSPRPQNVQQAAVCIEKIADAHPEAASEALGRQRRRLASAARRLRKRAAATARRPPRRPWDGTEGTPRWFAAVARAQQAVERVVSSLGRGP